MASSVLAAALIWLIPARGADTNTAVSAQTPVRFGESAPYAARNEVLRRLGAGNNASVPDYNITNEQFRIVQPVTYSTNSTWGLFVWISPGDDAQIPANLASELARHQLLAVSAHNSGNDRRSFDRIRLALDATYNMSRKFKVDRKRTFVGGFSGGARVASVLGVAYADIFAGTLCLCGVDFYQKLPFGNGQYYPVAYLPDPRVLTLAKRSDRYVLLTGEHDANRENTKVTLEKGFRPEGFKNVLYLEVPGMKHAVPGTEFLNTALEYLEGTNSPPVISPPNP